MITPEEHELANALHEAERAWNIAAAAIVKAGLEIETSSLTINTLHGDEPIINSAVSKVLRIRVGSIE